MSACLERAKALANWQDIGAVSTHALHLQRENVRKRSQQTVNELTQLMRDDLRKPRQQQQRSRLHPVDKSKKKKQAGRYFLPAGQIAAVLHQVDPNKSVEDIHRYMLRGMCLDEPGEDSDLVSKSGARSIFQSTVSVADEMNNTKVQQSISFIYVPVPMAVLSRLWAMLVLHVSHYISPSPAHIFFISHSSTFLARTWPLVM